MNSYHRQVAVITGAGSGIGRALALELASRGARLSLWDRDAESVFATARKCADLGADARPATIDVTDPDTVTTTADRTFDEFGRIDILFCCAGVILSGPLTTTDINDVQQLFDINVVGVMQVVQAFLPHLIASGAGRIVTMSSAFGLMATPYYSAYSSSKFAVRGFSDSLRQELALAGRPVAVTCVYPGGVRTPIVRNGMFGRGEDSAEIIQDFEQKIARTEPQQAATAILRGVEHGRATVLVGADARLVAAFVWAAGHTYPGLLIRLIPWVPRLRAIQWRPSFARRR